MSKLIPLTKGQFAIVDDVDFDWLSRWRWQCVETGNNRYASRTKQGIKMHRVILSAPTGMLIDHIDGNGLNNQRSNLRLATSLQNAQNQQPQQRKNKLSPYKGVTLSSKKWRAHIRVNGELLVLGRFDTEIEAACAYNHAAIKYFGQFAYVNDIPGWETSPAPEYRPMQKRKPALGIKVTEDIIMLDRRDARRKRFG